MNLKWAGRTATVAVVTAALTVAAGMPLLVTADASRTEAVTVAKGTFAECAVELVAGKFPYKPGEKPELVLKLASNAGESVEIEATVVIEGTSITSEMSRMAPISFGVLWEHTAKVLIVPGETKELALPVNITVPEKRSLSFRLLLGPQPNESTTTDGLPLGPQAVERAVLSALQSK